MLFSRAALQQVGLLDERFFLVYEESDWCFRARRQGFACVMAPQAKVWHKIGASFGSELSPLRAYFSTRNQLLFGANHLQRKDRLRLLLRALARLSPRLNLGARGAAPWKRLWWGLAEARADLRRRKADPVQRAARRGVYDYLRGRFGDCPPVVRELNRVWVRP
jgi:GT2 family glycosyltransferase